MLPSCPHPSATCFCAQCCFERVHVDTRGSSAPSPLLKGIRAIGRIDHDLENLFFSYKDSDCLQRFAFTNCGILNILVHVLWCTRA